MTDAEDREARRVLTRRAYLAQELLLTGVPFTLLREAISSTAIEHPEWDMTERKTLAEWRSGS